jgi:hypothetical protein
MRVDQWLITVKVAGRNLGTFDKMSGGNVTTEGSKRRPGGMGAPKSYGGPSTLEDVEVVRAYEREQHNLAHWLVSVAGNADAEVIKQPLDRNKSPFGRPLVYRGTLMDVTFPDPDSESSDVGELTLRIETEGELS